MKIPYDYSIHVTTTPFSNGVIEQKTDIMGEITRKVMDTREYQVQQALMQLGWLPPEESFKVLDCLSDIQQACIGEIAMGYNLDAEYIGRKISEATGKTAPELLMYLRERE